MRGRVLAWFDSHPMTEEVDRKTLHAGMPMIVLSQAVKLAATAFNQKCTSATLYTNL
jgi:hypothetical protein